MISDAASADVIRSGIDTLIEEHGAELVAAYFRQPEFAGDLFDTLGVNEPHRLAFDDLLAASLLDVRFKPQAVRRLVRNPAIDSVLSRLDTDVALWNVSRGDQQHDMLELWHLLVDVPGIGGTRASKLMARKRPHLFPILDSVIRHRLQLGNVDAWSALRDVLDDDDLRARIDGLWTGDQSEQPSTLRLLDVLTWMRFSESGNARKVRKTLKLASE